jgi:TrmH family RNA methyltransferase
VKVLDIIQSKDNPLIKEVKKLKEKRYRIENSEFIAEGFRFVIEALQSDFEVTSVFVAEKDRERWEKYNVAHYLKKETKVFWVTDQILKLLSSTETPQGIVAVVKIKKSHIIDSEGFYILVDKIQDPGNLGTIIRTADAAGALGVIATKGTVDVYNEKTLRSTMGSIFHIPVIEAIDMNIVQELKQKGFKVIVSSLEESKSFYDVKFTDRFVLSVGNEGNGISDELINLGDIKVKIPMPGKAESLNAGVAASIMIFEAVRQRLTTASK